LLLLLLLLLLLVLLVPHGLWVWSLHLDPLARHDIRRAHHADAIPGELHDELLARRDARRDNDHDWRHDCVVALSVGCDSGFCNVLEEVAGGLKMERCCRQLRWGGDCGHCAAGDGPRNC